MIDPSNRKKHRPSLRKWHAWLGITTSILVVVSAVTGIYLNHRDLFRTAKTKSGSGDTQAILNTSTRQTDLPSLDAALSIVHKSWGDKDVERIEIKEQQGQIVYVVKAADGLEAIVDLDRGRLKAKPPLPNDWGKTLKDLHTGRIGGWFGKLAVDGTALTLLVLTGTGIYIWASPLFRRRRQSSEIPILEDATHR